MQNLASPAALGVNGLLNGIDIDVERMELMLPAEGPEGNGLQRPVTSLSPGDLAQWGLKFDAQARAEQRPLSLPDSTKLPWYVVAINPEKYLQENTGPQKDMDVATRHQRFLGADGIWRRPFLEFGGTRLTVHLADETSGRIIFRRGGLAVEAEFSPKGVRMQNVVMEVSKDRIIQFVRGSGILAGLKPAWFYRLFPAQLMLAAAKLAWRDLVEEQPEIELDQPHIEKDAHGAGSGSVGVYDAALPPHYWQPSLFSKWFWFDCKAEAAAVYVQRIHRSFGSFYRVKIGDLDPTSSTLPLSGRTLEMARDMLGMSG